MEKQTFIEGASLPVINVCNCVWEKQAFLLEVIANVESVISAHRGNRHVEASRENFLEQVRIALDSLESN